MGFERDLEKSFRVNPTFPFFVVGLFFSSQCFRAEHVNMMMHFWQLSSEAEVSKGTHVIITIMMLC